MLIHPQFDPIAIHLGPVGIHWYGLMYLLGFMLFLVLGRMRARQSASWKPAELDDLLFYGVLGVILGGRLGYVLFYKPDFYFSHPLDILKVWEGGMAFHGGFLGVLVAMWVFGRKTNRSFFRSPILLPRWCRLVWLPAVWVTLSMASSGAASRPWICRWR